MFDRLVHWFERKFGSYRHFYRMAEVLRKFPKGYHYEPNLMGCVLVDPNRPLRVDALTWLALSGEFRRLGLRVDCRPSVIVPVYRGTIMVDAIMKAFNMGPAHIDWFFDPKSYLSGISLGKIAERIEHHAISYGSSLK